MITRIEASPNRCFRRLAVDVGNFCVLVGANGSGKTTFLDLPGSLGNLLDTKNKPRSSVIYQKLASLMSVNGYTDTAFTDLRAQFRTWFPREISA